MAAKPHGVLSFEYQWGSSWDHRVETFPSKAAAMRRLKRIGSAPDRHFANTERVIEASGAVGRGTEWRIVPLTEGKA